MGRKKIYKDINYENVKTTNFEITYDVLIKTLKKYKVSQVVFCEAAGISTATFQKVRHNILVSKPTLKKMIMGLNKINPNKNHQVSDILRCAYIIK